MFDHEFSDFETAAVRKELRAMKRTFRIGLAACAFLSGVIGFSAGTLAAKSQKGSVVVQSVERRPQNLENIPVTSINIPSVAALTQNSVVEIRTESVTNSLFLRQFVTEGAGSGVIISEDGYIVTNNHVIQDARAITVALHDGTTYEAQLIATDSKMDIGVIKIEASGLTPAILGDSDSLSVGEPVVAVGNPLGQLGGTVTDGIVSALDREIILNNERRNLLQTNAAINPGNSGGALVNDNGELVGINSLIESYSGSSSGVGFAIPVNYAKNIADQIIDGKTPVHPYLGATLSSVNALNARTNKLSTDSGAYVASVVEDGPAAKAGIQEGDVITKLGDDEISSADGLIIALRSHEVGEKVEITLMRGKEEKKVTVELGSDEELQNQQQDDSATDTGNGGITDEQLRQYLEELLGQQGQGQGYGQGY